MRAIMSDFNYRYGTNHRLDSGGNGIDDVDNMAAFVRDLDARVKRLTTWINDHDVHVQTGVTGTTASYAMRQRLMKFWDDANSAHTSDFRPFAKYRNVGNWHGYNNQLHRRIVHEHWQNVA